MTFIDTGTHETKGGRILGAFSPFSIGIALFFALICLAMIWNAVPRILGGGPAERAGDVISRLNHQDEFTPADKRVTAKDIESGLQDLNKAIARLPDDGELYLRRALLRRTLMDMTGKPSVETYRLIEQDSLEAIKHIPGNPYAWFMVAYAKQAIDGKLSPEAIRAFEAALLFGRSEGSLVLPRISLGLRYWDQLPPSTRDLVEGQIRISLNHWYLIKPFGAFIAALPQDAQDKVMNIVEHTQWASERGIRRLKRIIRENQQAGGAGKR